MSIFSKWLLCGSIQGKFTPTRTGRLFEFEIHTQASHFLVCTPFTTRIIITPFGSVTIQITVTIRLCIKNQIALNNDINVCTKHNKVELRIIKKVLM